MSGKDKVSSEGYQLTWHGCDWVTVTAPFSDVMLHSTTKACARDWLSVAFRTQPAERLVRRGVPWTDASLPYYPDAVRSARLGLNVGARKGRGSGVIVQATGSSPAWVKASLYNHSDIEAGGNLTRFDYAWDIKTPDGYGCWEVYEELGLRWETSSEASRRFVTSNSGATIYAGKRSDDLVVRVYDRDVTLHDGEIVAGVRVEVELKGRKARGVAESGQPWPVAPLTGDLFRRMPGLRRTGVGRAILSEDGQPPTVPVPPPSGDPEQWAERVVIPWLEKLTERDPRTARRVVRKLSKAHQAAVMKRAELDRKEKPF